MMRVDGTGRWALSMEALWKRIRCEVCSACTSDLNVVLRGFEAISIESASDSPRHQQSH